MANGKAYVTNYADGTVTVIAWPMYHICPLYDETKAVRSRSTVPLKLQVCDSNGANLSSPDLIVTATQVTRTASDAPGLVSIPGMRTRIAISVTADRSCRAATSSTSAQRASRQALMPCR